MRKRKRALERAQNRALAKITRDLERLAVHAPGGSAERAIVITSPSEVEVQAKAMPCAICRGAVRVEEHTAETVGAARVRVAKVVCTVCRAPRSIYFRLASTTLS